MKSTFICTFVLRVLSDVLQTMLHLLRPAIGTSSNSVVSEHVISVLFCCWLYSKVKASFVVKRELFASGKRLMVVHFVESF